PGRLEDLLETLTDGSHQFLDGTAPTTDHRASLGGEHIGMDFGWTGKPKPAWQQGRHLTTPSKPVGAGRPGVGTELTTTDRHHTERGQDYQIAGEGEDEPGSEEPGQQGPLETKMHE